MCIINEPGMNHRNGRCQSIISKYGHVLGGALLILIMIRLRLPVMIRSITLVFKNLSSHPKMVLVISPSNLNELLM